VIASALCPAPDDPVDFARAFVAVTTNVGPVSALDAPRAKHVIGQVVALLTKQISKRAAYELIINDVYELRDPIEHDKLMHDLGAY
jgi:hypothetical protein